MEVSTAELLAVVGVVVGIVSGVVTLTSRWTRAIASRTDERTRHIIEQMRPNDGSTLRDQIDWIRAALAVYLDHEKVTAAEIAEQLHRHKSERHDP